MSSILRHPTIGAIQGNGTTGDVTQYLGVQYATLRDKFARGKLLDDYGEIIAKQGGILQATHFASLPSSPVDACDFEQRTYLQKRLPERKFEQSSTDCLTLNMAVPCRKTEIPMPVVVFVHGGGFAAGSSSFPQNDLERIAQIGVDSGMNTIFVGINYRLGAAGFLNSTAMRSAGYLPNNGLDDQRVALRWVQRHIAGFGGDPLKVTFVGQSAGSVSGFYHLQSDEPLFHQFIAMSGTPLQRAKSGASSDGSFRTVVEILGLSHLSPDEQVLKLRDMDGTDLTERLGRRVALGPVKDNDLVRDDVTFDDLFGARLPKEVFPGIRHCKRIMAGDCQLDSMFLAGRLAGRTDILARTLIDKLSEVLHEPNANVVRDLATAYELDRGATSNDFHTTIGVLHFAQDLLFVEAMPSLAGLWEASNINDTVAFLYHFDCPNPFEGKWAGYTTHVQDVAFLFQNLAESLPEGQRKVGVRFAKDAIAFTHGKEPWPAYNAGSEEKSMVYYAKTTGESDDSGTFTGRITGTHDRRDILRKVVGPDKFDKLLEAWQMFMSVRN